MRPLLLIAASLMLAGCVKLLPDPPEPPRLYPLEAGDVARGEGAHVSAIVSVAAPDGPQALMGDSIVWRRDGAIAFLAGAAWPGRADDLLQAMAVELVNRQGLLDAAVSNRGAGVSPDIEVRWDISAFDIREEGGALEARFAAQVRVTSSRRRTLLASEFVDVREPVAELSGSLAANALARAARKGCARIAEMAYRAAIEAETQDAERPPEGDRPHDDAQPSAASTSR